MAVLSSVLTAISDSLNALRTGAVASFESAQTMTRYAASPEFGSLYRPRSRSQGPKLVLLPTQTTLIRHTTSAGRRSVSRRLTPSMKAASPGPSTMSKLLSNIEPAALRSKNSSFSS